MNLLKLALLGALSGVIVVILIQIMGSKINKTYAVVKSGNCYSYKYGSWVSTECFDSFDSASEFVEGVKRIEKLREEAYLKDWVEVEE